MYAVYNTKIFLPGDLQLLQKCKVHSNLQYKNITPYILTIINKWTGNSINNL